MEQKEAITTMLTLMSEADGPYGFLQTMKEQIQKVCFFEGKTEGNELSWAPEEGYYSSMCLKQIYEGGYVYSLEIMLEEEDSLGAAYLYLKDLEAGTELRLEVKNDKEGTWKIDIDEEVPPEKQEKVNEIMQGMWGEMQTFFRGEVRQEYLTAWQRLWV